MKASVLLIIEQCNPEWSSVPLEGYKYYREISNLTNVMLVTHERNKKALKKQHSDQEITFIPEGQWIPSYYSVIDKLTSIGRKNWPLYHTLSYPIYEDFNSKVYRQFKDQVLNKKYDLVHVITPMMPRYPVKLIKACQQTPFIIGPVNGGVPFPPGFKKVGFQEFAFLNFLRSIGRALIPGYKETYQKADMVLAGSTYTFNFLKKNFQLADRQIKLFYENGISQDFFSQQTHNIKSDNDKINLLFVGRLVPYKGVDMLIESISQLSQDTRRKIQLTIVGDGSEKEYLMRLVKERNLNLIVHFIGWLKQQETIQYYRNADIFCFPSIREFGGAVVLEAMANGLPCIVANNGGIGEYVTAKTGFSIEPKSRDYLIQEMSDKIETLVNNQSLWHQMAIHCLERAREFEWSAKAQQIYKIYQQILGQKSMTHRNHSLPS